MGAFSSLFFKTVPKLHVALFRATGGAIGRKMGGVEMLLLTTTGRRSGLERTCPLLYIEDDHPDYPDSLIIVGSKAGAPKHPAWYLNLIADPSVTAQVGRDVRPMRAAPIDDDEDKARLWARLVEVWPSYAQYQRRTERAIPVIRLSPR